MKSLKKYIFAGVALTLMASCSDFLDTLPSDALTPETTWKTEQDAQKFLIGCYDGWEKGEELLYMDCASDFVLYLRRCFDNLRCSLCPNAA
jgi:starch-binding outer membrane protein, SusD/RagB family